MSGRDPTPAKPAIPPISSSASAKPQETLLLRGAFDPPSTPGTLGRLDRFEILHLLGEGGMGQVYLAREPVTGVQVAIKIMKPQSADDPQAVHRFLIEARHMYGLSHPHILRVLEVSDRREGPYYVMPYVEGGSLLALCKPGQALPERQLLPLAQQVAGALAYAHTRGIIHRDLKPGNVLLDNNGNAFLSDFGLVRTVFNDSMVDATASHLEGTAPYMSPAVARGEAEDTRCDIYAFGAVLYELLTGQPPYSGRTPQIILDQVLKGPPPPIHEVNPKANPALVKIAEACMARELRDRYASMADVAADLDRVAKGEKPLGPHQQRRGSPKIVALLIGVLAVASLAGFSVHYFSSGITSSRPVQTGIQSPVSAVSAKTAMSAEKPQIPSGLVAWWPGDGNAEDIIGHRKGEAINGADYGPGLAGQAFRVNGQQYFRIPHDPALAFTNGEALTLEAWVYRTGSGLPFHVMGKRLPDMNFYQIAFDGRNREVPTNQWMHLMVVYPKASTPSDGVMQFYVNGSLDCAYRWASRFGSNNAAIYIGTAGSNVSSEGFSGLIQHVRIYNRALMPVEVKAVYDLGIPSVEDGYGEHVGSSTGAATGQINAGETSAATAPYPFTCTTNNGAITIDKYTGPGGVVTIPATINGLPVVRIGNSAFIHRGDVTGVSIPNSVTQIGGCAFFNCGGLTQFTIPDSVTNVGGQALNFCGGLTRLEIPKSVTSFPAVIGCYKLHAIVVDAANPVYWSSADGVLFNKDKTSLISCPSGKSGDYEIPATVTDIPWGAFQECANLSHVTVPNGVTNIGNYAFAGCSKLTGIAIPASVTSVGFGPFIGTTELSAITVDTANPAYGERDGVLFDKKGSRLVSYPGGKAGSYVVPDGVAEIVADAFSGCRFLPTVTLPTSLTRLSRGAFANCGDLTALYFNGNAPWAGQDVFVDSKKVTIYYRPGAKGWGNEFGGRPTAVWTGVAAEADAPPPAVEADIYQFACTASNGAITIARYTGDGGAVVIPSKVSGLPVTMIKNDAFLNCSNLTSVTIPTSVTTIGSRAFKNCSNLAKAMLGDGLTSIGDEAFWGCNKLNSVAIPNSVTNIAWLSFSECNGMTNVTVGNSVTRIGDWTFKGCTGLTDVTIGNNVASIGADAFMNCVKLTRVVIPANTTSIAGSSFIGCSNLVSILVDVLNPVYSSSADGVLFNKEKTTLNIYPMGRAGSYVIPGSVTSIGNEAFRGCSSMTSVIIPASVANIEPNAFYDCGSLTSIVVDAANLVYLSSEDGVVFNKDKTKLVRYPTGKIGKYAIPDSVTVIESRAFGGCVGLTGVTIPNTVTYIGSFAFNGCLGLSHVTIPDSVDCLGGCAFTVCSNLTSVTMGRGITSIDGSTFVGCASLIDVTIPDSVTVIGGYAFYNCTSLTNVTIPNSVTNIESCAFFGCVSLASITIPDGVTKIGDAAFNGCTNLSAIIVGERITDIANSAFEGCGKLANFAIPRNVSSIGRHVFRGCASLAGVKIPNGVTSIGDGAFDGCTSLSNLMIPSGVTNIGDYAFRGCANLPSVTIPNGVTTIKGHWGGGTFNGCATLKSVMIPDSVTAIGVSAFMGCTNLSTVTVGNGVTNITGWAFGECRNLTDVYFKGNAPVGEGPFERADKVTIYYRSSTKGWGKEFGGRPTSVWNGEVSSATTPAASVQAPFTCTTNNGAVTIVKYTGPGGAVTIPATIDGLPVTVIGDGAFINRGDLPSITIPNSVTSIVGAAFFGCSGLTNIVIPKSVIVLYGGAFAFCSKLVSIEVDSANPAFCSSADGVMFDKENTRIVRYPGGKTGSYVIPSSVKTIGNNAFGGWSKLTGITIPNGVTNIEDWAFDSCGNLTSIVLPDSVATIGGGAFQGCPGLTNFVIPKGVVLVADVFGGCYKVASFTVDVENPVYSSSADGVLFDKAKAELTRYPRGKIGSYEVPGSVSKISALAFGDCPNLTYVTVPPSVTHIGAKAFRGCENLTAIYFKGDVPWIDHDGFMDCKKVTIYYRPGAKGWGKEFGGRPTAVWTGEAAETDATPASPETDIYQFACTASNGAITIARYTGDGGAVVIPGKVSGLPVTTIKNDAFQNCSNLTSLTIPNSITNIGGGAFKNCTGLAKVVIGDSVATIGDEAFWGCSKLTNVVLPASVTSIGGTSFFGCTGLISILVDNLNPVYSSSADGVVFNKDKTRLVCYPTGKAGSFAIPGSVTRIGHKAFLDCESLTAITIPNSVTLIEGDAFRGCSKLTTVTIPASVASITPNSFAHCDQLNAFTVDDANPVYSSSTDGVVFNKDKTRLIRFPGGKAGDYAIPVSVTQIADGAFEECFGLTSVTIPDRITYIDSITFKNCTNLTSVTIPASVINIGLEAFGGCVSLTNVTIPHGVTTIGYCAFLGCTNITSVTIPTSVTTIDGWAFANCRKLACVTIPDNTTRIGDWAFIGCTSLTNVMIGNNVTNIDSSAFGCSSNLTSVYFQGNAPNSVLSFSEHSRLTVYYRHGTKGWGKEFGGRPTAVWEPKGLSK